MCDRDRWVEFVVTRAPCQKVSTGEDNEAQIRKELEILSNICHKNIIRLYEFIERPEK